MVRKNPEANKEVKTPRRLKSNAWGVQDPSKRKVRLPSGQKMKFTDQDQEAILVFLGIKDISERVIDPETKEPKEAGSVLYYVFHDGKRIVNLAEGFALRDYQADPGFEIDKFYYIHVADLLETGQPTAMKDLDIYLLGSENDDANVDEEYMGKPTIKLTLPTIAELNYKFLNNPLRKV